jgi:hypothetical protein
MQGIDVAQASLVSLQMERKRLGIWLIGSHGLKVNIAETIAGKLGLLYIDLFSVLLPQLTDASSQPLGVYSPDNLATWLRLQAYDHIDPIIVDGAEPILATFGKSQARAFFRMATNLDVRSPIILVSYLPNIINAASFPIERIWQVSE